MSPALYRPIPSSDPADAEAWPLAGGLLRFAALERLDGARPARMACDAAPAGIMAALTAPRPALAGLALDRPRIMGILNVTPDSFSDGGLHAGTETAIAHGLRMAGEGADLLDIGGESTRPGAEPVPPAEEAGRVVPVIEGLRAAGMRAPISIDTRNAATAKAALAAGADIVNDVSGLAHDPDMGPLIAAAECPAILMHMRGTPQTMLGEAHYGDVIAEVFGELAARLDHAIALGIPRDRLIADPGIGFAKDHGQNIALIRRLSVFHALGIPILAGVSRKRFIGTLTGVAEARGRMPGSVAAAMVVLAQGVQMLRVHDVAASRQAVDLWLGLMGDGS